MKHWIGRIIIAASFVAVESPRAAYANEPNASEVAAAQRLYEEARRAMDRKNYAEACPKLQQVTELLPRQPAPHDTLGECYKALGRYGSAWEQFVMGQSMAAAKGDPKRATILAKKAKDLEPKVAKINVVVRKELLLTEDATILRDGISLDKAIWNMPMPVDTGDHLIEVLVPGREKWSKVVTVLADGAQLMVEVPALKPLPKPKPPPAILVMPRRPWQQPLGWTSMAIGGASVVTSIIVSGVAASKNAASKVDNHCNEANACDEVGKPLREQALGLANVATATMIFGGVLAAGGLVFVLTAPRHEVETANEKKVGQFRWNVVASPLGVGVTGVW